VKSYSGKRQITTPIHIEGAHTAAKPECIYMPSLIPSRNSERSVNMADRDDQPIPEAYDLPPEATCGEGDRIDEVRRSVQDALDETDRAIANHARYLQEKISEIEAMLGASVWRNPFL
jgi:hypothetical protein